MVKSAIYLALLHLSAEVMKYLMTRMGWALTNQNRCHGTEAGSESQGSLGQRPGWLGWPSHGWGRICLWICRAVFQYVSHSACHTCRAPAQREMENPPLPVDRLSDHCVYEKIGELRRVRLTFPASFKLFVCFGVSWDSEYNFIQTALGYQKLSFLFVDHSAQIGNLWAAFSLQMCFI